MSADHQFAPPELEELAKLLPAYHITAFIAKGGMGAVYRASQRSLDREVAIKILPMEFGEEAEFRKQFEAEAKAMAKLNHPNLVGVYDFGEVEGMLYIVMEYIPGNSLYYSINKKAIEQKEAARLVLGICEGLAHAHEAGILHRDIKPANILLDLKARPKIGDFGLASQVEGRDGEELAFGTPDYAAPELMQAGSNFSKRSDVFATGVILYEALTGKIPDPKYVPASQMAKVDPRFDRIIRRATHPTPSLRFADAAEMGKELQKLVDILNKTSSSSLVTTGNGGSAPNKLAPAANPDGTSVPHSPAPAPAPAPA
ncbi:MAG: serine/threonine-protein kinase, partial [Akkermansiaceae bacterium]|nr:serine/threonine-protein kinase [Akkermansiaceae bacterium]